MSKMFDNVLLLQFTINVIPVKFNEEVQSFVRFGINNIFFVFLFVVVVDHQFII